MDLLRRIVEGLYNAVTTVLFLLVIFGLLGLAIYFGCRSVGDFFDTDKPCGPVASHRVDHGTEFEPMVGRETRARCRKLPRSLNPNSYTLRTTALLSGLVLVVILLEIAESIFQQAIKRRGARLSGELVADFLVIGVVASVRHLLASGALSSILHQPTDPTVRALQELAVSAGAILVLAIGYVIVHKFGVPDRPAKLRELHSLHNQGLIDQNEFDERRKNVIANY